MYEDRSTIGLIENSWNDLDVLNRRTRMLHDHVRKDAPSVLRNAPTVDRVMAALPA